MRHQIPHEFYVVVWQGVPAGMQHAMGYFLRTEFCYCITMHEVESTIHQKIRKDPMRAQTRSRYE